MKAKLFKIQIGSHSELVIAFGHQDAKDACNSKKMGSIQTTLIGTVDYAGNQTNGLTHYKLFAECLPEDFGYLSATLSNRVYNTLSE